MIHSNYSEQLLQSILKILFIHILKQEIYGCGNIV